MRRSCECIVFFTAPPMGDRVLHCCAITVVHGDPVSSSDRHAKRQELVVTMGNSLIRPKCCSRLFAFAVTSERI